MKFFIICALIFAGVQGWTQEQPQDVFLEPGPDQAPQVVDAPPNEPPYTKTPDEIEAEKELKSQAKPAEKKQPVVKKETPKNPNPNSVVVESESGDKGRRKIAHPDAKKGLYLIDQNTGKYYYKTSKLSMKNQATSIRFGSVSAPDITSDLNTGKTITFTDIYKSSSLTCLMLDYEWQPFRSFGKLGVVLGLSFFTARGNGYFDGNVKVNGAAVTEAKEGYTFIGMPISVGGIYRLEFSDKQWFAPFIVGGGSYYLLGELRDDGKKPKAVGTPAVYGGGGIMFNITAVNKEVDFIMDREYGINNMWFTAEFRAVKSLNEDLDVSSNIINFGISVDY